MVSFQRFANLEKNLIDSLVGIRADEDALLPLERGTNNLTKCPSLAASWGAPNVRDCRGECPVVRLQLGFVKDFARRNCTYRCRVCWEHGPPHDCVSQHSVDCQLAAFYLIDLL